MARARRTYGPDASGWLGPLALTLLALYAVLTVYVLWRSAVLAPHSDEFDWIFRWYQLQETGDWAGYLFAPHNQHRIALTFGLLDLDMRWFRGTNLPLIASGALSLGVMALVLGKQAEAAAPAALRIPAFALGAMAVLMAGNVLGAATPICVTYAHAAALASLAIVLAEGEDGPALKWRRLGALACAVLAAFGNAGALAVWPVLAFNAARRWDRRWFFVVLVTGGLFIALYMAGSEGQAGGNFVHALADPMGAAKLAASYLFLPWTRLMIGVAWLPGAVIAVVSLGLVIWKSRSLAVPDRTAAALILFSLGTAAMAALGRTGFDDPANVPLRYAVFLAPLHVGVLMILAPYVGVLWRANRLAAQAVVVAVLVLALLQDGFMAMNAIRTSDIVRHTIADFHAGRRTPAMGMVHPDLAHAERLSERLRREGRFQNELHLTPETRP